MSNDTNYSGNLHSHNLYSIHCCGWDDKVTIIDEVTGDLAHEIPLNGNEPAAMVAALAWIKQRAASDGGEIMTNQERIIAEQQRELAELRKTVTFLRIWLIINSALLLIVSVALMISRGLI